MKWQKPLGLFSILLVALACTASDCEDKTDVKHERETNELMAEADRQIGLPKIHNFNERKLATLIMEMRDSENLPTFAYFYNERTGTLTFFHRTIGFGLPYGTQVTNPQKWVGNGAVLPQPEPNGLFMPESAEATWLMIATPKGPRPIYVEPRVIVSPVALTPDTPS